MNDALKGILNENETLKWTGSPENIKLTDSANKTKVMIYFGIALVWVILSIVLYIPFALKTGNTGIQLVIVLVIMDCIPILLVTSPIREMLGLRKSRYYITDKRVIVQGTDRVMSMVLNDGLRVRTEKSEGGLGHVLIGTAGDKKPSAYRVTAVYGDLDEKTVTGLAFYNIREAEKAASLISSK